MARTVPLRLLMRIDAIHERLPSVKSGRATSETLSG